MKYPPWMLLAGALSYPLVAQGTLNEERLICLTPEQEEILSHMSIVFLDDGSGNLVNKTIRFERINVQVVNGLDATNGFPLDPDSVDPLDVRVNGVGNLIVGYTSWETRSLTIARARTTWWWVTAAATRASAASSDRATTRSRLPLLRLPEERATG